MKIIEGMKKVNDLLRKAEDLRKKVHQYCAHYSMETPTYENTKQQVRDWIQAHTDIMKEVLKLKEAVQRTNLETQVTINLGDKDVTHSIAGWIHRRRDLAKLEFKCWDGLNDKGLSEMANWKNSAGELIEAKLIRNYAAEERDRMKEIYASEESTINARLEVVNAITDLIE